MRIAVFGLGYVGAVSAACLARDGHAVVGVDPQPAKVDTVARGRSPVVEPYVGELLSAAAAAGTLGAVGDAREAVADADMSLVCVGTPSRRNGSIDTAAIARVTDEIGRAVRATGKATHLVVVRSTVLPGTMRGLIVPALEAAAARAAGPGLRIAHNPEFLRESTAVYDYDHPAKTVVGALDPGVAREVLALYRDQPGRKIATTLETAEMVKYTDNAWHALKVAFANEIGNIAQAVGTDSHAVMDIFCQDEKLNISPSYLKPGFAFGGSCLPKDVRALVARARELDLELPLLESLMPTNRRQVERALEHVLASGARRVAVLGISFKAGTDDLRESPQVALVEQLIGKGLELSIYDRNVSLARLVGANRAYIEETVPHIARLLAPDLDAAIADAELVVVGNGAPEFRGLAGRLRPDQRVYDLVRLPELEALGERYAGVNW